MAIKRTTKVEPSFSMSSMTDIVFLLLIFFLVTSTLINPNALKLLLPKSTGQVSAKATVSVSIKDMQLAGKKRMEVGAFLAGFRDPENWRCTPGTSKDTISSLCCAKSE